MKPILFTISFFMCFSVFTQTIKLENNLSISVDKIDGYINQVFTADFFVNREFIRDSFREALKERVFFATKNGIGSNTDIPLLSEVGLLRNADPKKAAELILNFDIRNFNPLYFNINLFPLNESAVYRIDGTDFIIVITPQNAKK